MARLREEGYLTGSQAPDAEPLKKLLLLTGRNVGEQALGEVEALVRDGPAAPLRGESASPEPGEQCRALVVEAAAWLRNLRASPAVELSSLVAILNGRHIPSGVSGDPLRAGAALPAGRNMRDQDPRGFPSKAAWAAGQRLANQL